MGFFRRISTYFYVSVVIYIAVYLIGMSTDRIPNIDHTDVINLLHVTFNNDNLRYLAGIFGAFLVVINYIFFRMLSIKNRKDKIIAFDNPNGRVTVSLFAMEDMIRRMLMQFIEIKDVKPVMIATSKGLHVKVPLVLKSDLIIPEVTARVQSQVLKKVQNTIGMDQPVDVNVYVGKIHPEKFKERIEKPELTKKEEPVPENKEPVVPYQGQGYEA